MNIIKNLLILIWLKIAYKFMMKFKKNYKNKAQNNLIYLLNVFFLRYKLKKIQNKFKNNLKFIK